MLTRRSLLKALAAGPLFSLIAYGHRTIPSAMLRDTGDSEYVHVLLHGLIFLEFQDSRLIATAPDVPTHSYEIGIPSQKLKKAPAAPHNVLDWTSILRGGAVRSFPRSIPQFSKSASGVGDLTATFRFRLVLPLPVSVIPLRLGRLADFPAATTGNVWTSMKEQSGPDLALITCLRYEGKIDPKWSTSNRCHFYAEPTKCLPLAHMNDAFKKSQRTFQNASAFDLQVDPHTVVPLTKPEDPQQPGYLTQRDELCLAELTKDDACKGPNPVNCGQLAINP